MSAVIPISRAIAMNDPAGMNSLMLEGQKTDGRTNHARNASTPSHGAGISDVGDGVARSNAVSQTIPTMR